MITDKYQNIMFSYTDTSDVVRVHGKLLHHLQKNMKCQRHHIPNYNCTSYKVALAIFLIVLRTIVRIILSSKIAQIVAQH